MIMWMVQQGIRGHHVRLASNSLCKLRWPGAYYAALLSYTWNCPWPPRNCLGVLDANRTLCTLRILEIFKIFQPKRPVKVLRMRNNKCKIAALWHTPPQCSLTLGILLALPLAISNYKGIASKTELVVLHSHITLVHFHMTFYSEF